MWLKSIDKESLHPALVQVMDAAFSYLAAEGTPFKAYSGLRTFEEQDRLYAKGRDANGVVVNKKEVVTNAKGGQSMHNYGLAVDVAPFNLLTKDPDDVWWPDFDRHSKVWYALERAVMDAASGDDSELEFEWGGRWKFRDAPHVQVRTTLAELRQGLYPYCSSVDWLVKAHTTFLLCTPWMDRRVQHLLNMQSYKAGPVDGVYGTMTATAMDEFCRDRGLLGAPRAIIIEELVRLDHAAVSKRKDPLCEG